MDPIDGFDFCLGMLCLVIILGIGVAFGWYSEERQEPYE